ncbi:MAG: aminoacyl-histidine dipeptidase [Bacteroidales bacterium]|nr:aminoacyl-histidine dipeptidase [Bacteroidales bacterium]
MSIATLNPERVWKHFYALTQIPRPSKHERKAIEFAAKFGKDLGLETIVDEVGNVIIRKPATKGMENRKGIILQGHLDMVPQKNNDKVHDFKTDPIEAYADGDWVKAKGTTLGADNGIGLAMAMAVLEANDLEHGPIEALFTADEETGMTGAFGLKPGLLNGDILINLDSEEEGELCTGCAGGLDGTFTFNYKEESVPANYEAYKLTVSGLKGGHSGVDIALGRGNANKILLRILYTLDRDYKIRLAAIDGGSLRNAIPREASASFVAPAGKATEIQQTVEQLFRVMAAELSATDGGLKVLLEPITAPATVIDATTQKNIILAIYACPNGVMRMSDSLPIVETSTNLAIVKSNNGELKVNCLLRSSVDSAKEALSDRMNAVFTLAGAEVEFSGAYPGWKPNPASAILQTMKEVYKRLYGKEPLVSAIHAGLECGLLGGVYPNLDMISCGPTIRFPHSPDEQLDIASVDKCWKFLLETLKNAPAK